MVAQFEFGFVSAPLSKLGSFVERLLWIGEAYKSDLAQTDTAPMMTRLVYSRSQQDGPLDCWGEVIGADIPDVGGEGRLRLLGVFLNPWLKPA